MKHLHHNNNKHSKDDNRNLFIAIAVSLIILAGFHFFYEKPRQEAERAQQEMVTPAAQKQAQNQAELDAPVTQQTPSSAPSSAQAFTSRRIAIETPSLSGSLALTGGRIDELLLKDYDVSLDNDAPVQLLAPEGTEHPYHAEFGWLSGTKNIATPTKNSVWQQVGSNDLTPKTPVTLRWNNGQGLVFEQEISLDENYLFTVRQKVTNQGGSAVTLYPYGLVKRKGMPADYQSLFILHEGPIGYFDGSLKEIDYDDLHDEDAETAEDIGGWTGFTDKYWLTAMMPAQERAQDYRFSASGTGDVRQYQSDYRSEAVQVPAGGVAQNVTYFFAGAKKLSLLESYSEELNVPHLDLAIDFGWFYFITKPFFHVIDFLYNLVGNFGIAIIIFTICLRLCLFPLANKSFKSMAKMKKLAPQMEKLKEKYGNDREKLQKAIMEMYQKEQVNPFGGCLPILIQIPIFFALYKVLYVTIEMRHAPFFGWIQDLSQPDPTSIFNAFGYLPWDVPTFLMIGAWPTLMCLTLVLQQQLNPKMQDPMQAKMMMIFPFFMTFMLARFPAGLVVYWTFSNLFSVMQQYVIMKRMGLRPKKKKAE